MPNKLSSFVWDFYPWLRWKDSNLRIEGSKPSVLPLHYTPLNSIAFHPFYGTPYIFPKLAWVATPTLILLYHSH